MTAKTREMGRLAAVLGLVGALSLGIACNGGTSDPDPSPPMPPPDGPPPEPPPPGVACNASRTGAAAVGRSLDDVERRATRIVGGEIAAEDAWPFGAAIHLVRPDGTLFQYCGGSLIAANWVLTAAHCEVADGDKIVLGRHDLSGSGGQVRDVAFVLTHADYDGRTNDNDVALVKLASASTIAPVGLIDVAETHARPGDPSTVIGWGALSEGGPTSVVLRQVEVPVRSQAECEAAYGASSITANMLCAGFDAGRRDSCQGDSGGPLLVRGATPDSWRQAGIVSWGEGCAREGRYGVYTRLSRYLDWVDACTANPPS